MDADTSVKQAMYRFIVKHGKVPTSSEIAEELNRTVREVASAFERLHAKRLLVPEPGDPSRIRMAPPFSGIETSFPVRVRNKTYYANCVWDALGVPAALHEDATIDASDGHTDEPLCLEVRDGRPIERQCIVHFAVPAAKW